MNNVTKALIVGGIVAAVIITVAMINSTQVFADGSYPVMSIKDKTLAKHNNHYHLGIFVENIPEGTKYLKAHLSIDGKKVKTSYFTNDYVSIKIENKWADKLWKIYFNDKNHKVNASLKLSMSDFDLVAPLIKYTSPNGNATNYDESSLDCIADIEQCNLYKMHKRQINIFKVINVPSWDESLLEKEYITCYDQYDGQDYADSFTWKVLNSGSSFHSIGGYCTDASGNTSRIGIAFQH